MNFVSLNRPRTVRLFRCVWWHDVNDRSTRHHLKLGRPFPSRWMNLNKKKRHFVTIRPETATLRGSNKVHNHAKHYSYIIWLTRTRGRRIPMLFQCSWLWVCWIADGLSDFIALLMPRSHYQPVLAPSSSVSPVAAPAMMSYSEFVDVCLPRDPDDCWMVERKTATEVA